MTLKQQIRNEVLSIFPEIAEDRAAIYCTRGWIFPNHFDPMIDIAKQLCAKYGGDEEICELACLLHDTGLVYKRESRNPAGHESRSIEFAIEILSKYEVSPELKESILNCIRATEVEYAPKGINEKIVRSADILSQFFSIHFFAKAHFYETWEMYLTFLEKKIDKNFAKICFEDERKKAAPIRDYMKQILQEHYKYTKQFKEQQH